jgi:hypothetical protein
MAMEAARVTHRRFCGEQGGRVRPRSEENGVCQAHFTQVGHDDVQAVAHDGKDGDEHHSAVDRTASPSQGGEQIDEDGGNQKRREFPVEILH